jgi:hypothetical protein
LSVIDARNVTAVLITRGDQPEMIRRITETLIFPKLMVWDNSVMPNRRIYSRFLAMLETGADVCYSQDDDCIVPPETQQALCDAYEPGMIVSNYGHGNDEGGYGDLPLPCGGALYPVQESLRAIHDYMVEYGPVEWGRDEDAYADFLVGVLVPFKQLHLPFEINMEVAQGPERLCNQPWAYPAKARVVERARMIRDRVPA